VKQGSTSLGLKSNNHVVSLSYIFLTESTEDYLISVNQESRNL